MLQLQVNVAVLKMYSFNYFVLQCIQNNYYIIVNNVCKINIIVYQHTGLIIVSFIIMISSYLDRLMVMSTEMVQR